MDRDYARIEAAEPNSSGRHPGMFAMLTALRRSGHLSPGDAGIAEQLVERSYALHDEPPAEVFDTAPRAISWFIVGDSPGTADLLELAADVAALLGRYGIASREVRSANPGRITYADEVQVVAVPTTGWPGQMG